MRRVELAVLAAGGLALSACQTTPAFSPSAAVPAEFGRSDHVVVARVQPGDNAETLAARYLNDPTQAWRVAALPPGPLQPGGAAVIPLQPLEGVGSRAEARYVPVLCYHRFSAGRSGSAMEVSAASFEAQLDWLAANGYTVAPLSALKDYLDGRRALPAKTVVITIDDGYRSAYQVAYPILKRRRTPATLFVYTDFVGSGAALTWPEMREMQASGLVDVQDHSKSHGDMVKRAPGEGDAAYARRLHAEVETPLALLSSRAGSSPDAFAYPYGAADMQVAAAVRRAGYPLGLTVARGGNAAWADPMLLRRDMIYGSDSLEAFARRVHAAEQGERATTPEVGEEEAP